MKFLQWYPKLSSLSESIKSKIRTSLPQVGRKIRNIDLTDTYKIYDKLTGLDHVRAAHALVTEAEEGFVKSQLARRQHQLDVFKLEEAKSRINAQLDTVNRSDEGFLRLVTELHELSRQHKDAKQLLASAELAEQVTFEKFSGALRQSQAEERLQNGRMRQWSIGFSLLAGFIGFSATWLRFRTLESSKAKSGVYEQMPSLSLTSLNTVVESLNKNLKRFGNEFESIRAELRQSTLRIHDNPKSEKVPTPTQEPDREVSVASAVAVTVTAIAGITGGVLFVLALLMSGR